MANISQLNMGISFDGSDADAGMSKTGTEAENLSKKVQKADSTLAKIGKTSYTEILSMGRLAMAVYNTGKSYLGMVTAGENLRIKLATLTGSWESGVSTMRTLQDTSANTGVGLMELSGGFEELTAAGISTGRALDVVKKAGGLDGLFGGGGQGVAAISGAMAGLNESAFATEEAFTNLRKRGIDTTSALIAQAEALTGQAVTAVEAMRMLRSGAILGGTGANIVENALNGPAAKEAARRFEASLDGQLARLSSGVSELFRDISSSIFEALPVKEIIAGLRGGIEAVRDIVQEIIDLFMPIIDPQNRLSGLNDAFSGVRDIVYDIAERFAKIGNDLKTTFDVLFAQISAEINKLMARLEFGPVGLIGGGAEGAINRALAGEDKLAQMKIKAALAAGEQRNQGVTNFFGGIRANAQFEDFMRDFWEDSVGDPMVQAAKNIEDMTKTAQQFNLSMRDSVLTPMERFNETMAKITIQQTQFLKIQDEELKTKNINILNRQKAGSIADFIGQNSIGTSYLADKAMRGSREEFDSIMRQRFGDQGMNIQERIARALDQSAQIEREQADLQKQLLQAWERVPKPAGVGFMPKGI